jgi:hypothetical protein
MLVNPSYITALTARTWSRTSKALGNFSRRSWHQAKAWLAGSLATLIPNPSIQEANMDGPQTNPNANHPGNAPRETPVSPSPPTDLPTVTLGGEEYRRWVRQEIATSLFVRASAIATGVGAVGIGIIYTLLTAQVGTKMQEYDRKIAAIDNTINAKWNAALPTIKTDLGNEAEVYITLEAREIDNRDYRKSRKRY